MQLVKKMLLLFVLFSFTFLLFAEIRTQESNVNYQSVRTNSDTRVNLLNESFPTSTIPTGWAAENLAAQWACANSANAGGSPYELKLTYTQFNGTTRFVSPVINAADYSNLFIEFKHMVDWYASPMTVGVATRSSSTDAWTTLWSVNPTANIAATTVTQQIQNADLPSSTFQFCFFFTGNLYNLDYWYIDDVKLFYPEEHDLATMAITLNNQYPANTPLTPVVNFKNVGLNSETADVFCKIYQYDQLVYTQSQSITLAAGANQDVSFPAFTPALANEMYKVEAYTNLATDTDASNNSLEKWFDTYSNPRQKVILEIGTGTWCQYCPGAAMGADDLHNNGQQVGIIEYHNGDSYVTPTGTARISYYNVSGFPTSIFDGTSAVVGGSNTQSMYSTFLPIYNQKIAQKSPFVIEFDGSMDGNTMNVTVNVTRSGRFLNPNTVLHFAITESDIAQNWHGQTQVDFVERAMVPNANGTAIDLVNNETVSVELTKEFASTWNQDHIEIVAFIQDPSSKVIYQGHMVHLSELTPSQFPAPTALVAVAGNGVVDLSWNAPSAADATLSGYKVYRNSTLITPNPISTLTYSDNTVVNGTSYSYYVTAVYTNPEGESAASNSVNATPDNPNLLPPANLTGVANGNDVTLNWAAPGTPGEGEWISHAADEYNDAIGTNSAAEFSVAQRFTSAQLATLGVVGGQLTSVRFMAHEPAATYTVKVWTGGTANPYSAGTVAATVPVTSINVDDWTEVALTTPVTIPANAELWIGYDINTPSGYPAGVDAGPALNGYGNMMYWQNSWTTLTALAATLDYNWIIQGYVVGATGQLTQIDYPAIPVEVSTLTNPFGAIPVTRNQSNERNLTGYKVYRGTTLLTPTALPTTTLTYIDMNLPTGAHVYNVTAVYTDGESAPATVTVNVSSGSEIITVNRTLLGKNFPNPFNPSTRIEYTLHEASLVSIDIFNVKGQKVRSLINQTMSAGNHSVIWDGKDDQNADSGSGVYFYRMTTPNYSSTEKMILVK